jgi:hypothetical protein
MPIFTDIEIFTQLVFCRLFEVLLHHTSICAVLARLSLEEIQSYPKSVSPQMFLHTHISWSNRQGAAYDLT